MDVNLFGHKFIGVPLASNSLHNDPLIEKTVLELDTSNTSDSIPFSEFSIIVISFIVSFKFFENNNNSFGDIHAK